MVLFKIFIIFLTFCCTDVISLKCYKCRSDVDAKCAVRPANVTEEIDCPENDQCAVGIFKKITWRGCSSRLPSECTKPLCEICNSNLCNKYIFPKNRWSCYQCSGHECFNVTKSKLEPLPCQIYEEKDRCFTDIISIHNIIRGCASSKDNTCINICLKCDTIGCNNEQGVFESTCQSCQWMPGPSMYPKDFACKRDQHFDPNLGNGKCLVNRSNYTCTQKFLLGHREKCFIHWNPQVNVVVRGCSTTMGHFPSGKLWECFGDNCNNDCISMKCNVCSSENNPNCRNNTRFIHEEDCSEDTYSCFSCEDSSNKLTRGCGFEKSSYNKKCYNCGDDEGCNKNIVRTCYKCSSTEDINCIKWIDLTKINTELCSDPNEKCVITKTAEYTVRGCESKITECTESNPNCKRCEGSLCNVGEII